MSQQPNHVRLGGSVSARLLWIGAAAAIGALAYVVWQWMAPSSFGWLCLIPAVGALVCLRHGVFARWIAVGVLLMIGLAAGLLAVAESTSASTLAILMVVVLGLVTVLVLYLTYWQLPASHITIDARGVVVGAGRRESIFGWSRISQVAVRADRGIQVRLSESADPPRARLGPGGVRLIGRDAWVLSGRMDTSVAEIADTVVVAASKAGRDASVRFHGGASKPFAPLPPAPSAANAPNQAAEISLADIPDIARK